MYSRISGAKDGRGSIEYAEGISRNRNQERNILVVPINMIPNGKYAEQMEMLWKKARRNHTIQTRRIVVSFSKRELDPYNPEDINTAKEIVIEFIKTYYPSRQAVLYFQRDGVGGCLHCHAIVNDVSLTDHKGCTREQQYYKYVRNGIDKVASKYITLDSGKPSESKKTRTERVKAEKAAEIIKHFPELKGNELCKKLIEEKAYSFKEDMKGRIHEAMMESINEKDFFRRLKEKGIDAVIRKSKKYGEYYVYDFAKCPIGVKNTRSRSYKMGVSYGPEAVKTIWDEKKKQSQKTDANEFVTWMKKSGRSCFEYDDNGHLIRTDFTLWEELHEEFEKEFIKAGDTGDAPENSQNIPAIIPVEDGTLKKITSNNEYRHIRSSSGVIKKDLEDLKALIKETGSILKKLADDQALKEAGSRRYGNAMDEISTQRKKQADRSL